MKENVRIMKNRGYTISIEPDSPPGPSYTWYNAIATHPERGTLNANGRTEREATTAIETLIERDVHDVQQGR